MSGVAQRAGQVDIGAAAAVSRWEATDRADYASGISASPPATMSGQYGRSSTATNGPIHVARLRLARPLLPHGVDHVAGDGTAVSTRFCAQFFAYRPNGGLRPAERDFPIFPLHRSG